MTIHFRLISEFITIGTRSFEFDDTAILNPVGGNPLIMGEFLELSDAYKAKRGSADPGAVPSYAYFAEQGAYDVQGLGKGPLLFMHQYEAETKIFDATDLAYGVKLEVAPVTYGTLTRRGLQKLTTGYPIGHVTRITGNGWLRFKCYNM